MPLVREQACAPARAPSNLRQNVNGVRARRCATAVEVIEIGSCGRMGYVARTVSKQVSKLLELEGPGRATITCCITHTTVRGGAGLAVDGRANVGVGSCATHNTVSRDRRSRSACTSSLPRTTRSWSKLRSSASRPSAPRRTEGQRDPPCLPAHGTRRLRVCLACGPRTRTARAPSAWAHSEPVPLTQ